MGTQKNCLNETVLFEHQKYMFKLMGKKIITILGSKISLSGPLIIVYGMGSYLANVSCTSSLPFTAAFLT